MKRRTFNQAGWGAIATTLLGSAAITRLAAPAQAAGSSAVRATVYRDPACGCCHAWVDYLSGEGFEVTDQVRDDMARLKQQYGVPEALASCHTALIEDYVIEGHVPAADIRRLLAEQTSVVGIAAPGMPVGSPGMEMGDRHDSFDVVTFDRNGQSTLFNHYEGDYPASDS